MSDIRWQECPDCDGAGGQEGDFYGYAHDGSPITDWDECSTCCGTGEIARDTEMQTEDWYSKWEQEMVT